MDAPLISIVLLADTAVLKRSGRQQRPERSA